MNLKPGIVILVTRDLQQARSFYVEKLSLPVIEPLSSPTFITIGTAGDCQIALQSATAGQTAEPGNTELGFEVDDVDAVWHEWKARGVTTMTDPADMPFGRAFDAQDPDGHRLSVYALKER
jgi:predicted enzyme related to lactoylglutathione lyase